MTMGVMMIMAARTPHYGMRCLFDLWSGVVSFMAESWPIRLPLIWAISWGTSQRYFLLPSSSVWLYEMNWPTHERIYGNSS